MIASIEQRLAQLKPLPPAKKAAETDYFVIGTAEMADGLTVVNFVNFMTVAGQRKRPRRSPTSSSTRPGRQRYWQPMGRVKDEVAAKKLLARAEMIEKQVEAFPWPNAGRSLPTMPLPSARPSCTSRVGTPTFVFK